MKFGLDTNVLVYAEGYRAHEKYDCTLVLFEALDETQVFIPVQVLAELQRVLVMKAGRDPVLTRDLVLQYSDTYAVAPTTQSAFFSALELSSAHGLSIWDAIVLAVCAENACRVLITEDLQQGFTWQGVTVVNPYAKKRPPALQALLPEGFH